MKTFLTITMGLLLLTSSGGDKETLADRIAKYEKILVAVSPGSKIVRNPAVGEAKDNEEQIPSDLRDKVMEQLIGSLNEGFKTEAFQYYKDERADKTKMEEKGLEFFVIANLNASYVMSEAVNSDNMYNYKFKMTVSHTYFGKNEKGKMKSAGSGASATADCGNFTSPVKSYKLMGMLATCKPQCVRQKLVEAVAAKTRKYTAKQMEKAGK